MKKNGHRQQKQEDFIAPAMRAFNRVAKKLRVESVRTGRPLVLSNAGRTKAAQPLSSR